MTIFFALFDTAIGRCAIAWSARGVVGVQLPEADEAKTRSRVLQRFPGAWQAVPPPEMACVRDALAGLLRGLPSDLSFVRLDMDALMAASRRWRAPLGRPAPWGQALARNPFALIVPCHRVVAAGRRIGGFSAHGGITMKLRLLAIEGHESAAQANRAPGLFDDTRAAVRM